jgi:hypothetical protein
MVHKLDNRLLKGKRLMESESRRAILWIALFCVFGGVLAVAGLKSGEVPAQTACARQDGCASPAPHAWMASERARRFASVFKE